MASGCDCDNSQAAAGVDVDCEVDRAVPRVEVQLALAPIITEVEEIPPRCPAGTCTGRYAELPVAVGVSDPCECFPDVVSVGAADQYRVARVGFGKGMAASVDLHDIVEAVKNGTVSVS